MDLESTDSRNDNENIRNKTRCAALDVHETLTTHGEVETCLGDDEADLLVALGILFRLGTSELESDTVSDDGAVTDRDVCKGTSVDKDGSTLERLHHVGLDSILHESGESAGNTEVLCSHWITSTG